MEKKSTRRTFAAAQQEHVNNCIETEAKHNVCKSSNLIFGKELKKKAQGKKIQDGHIEC